MDNVDAIVFVLVIFVVVVNITWKSGTIPLDVLVYENYN